MNTIDITDVPRARVEPPRDRWTRPLITPVGGGKAVPYTRVSTLAKALDDNQGLINWAAAATVIGAMRRPGLHAAWQALIAEHGDPWYATDQSKAQCKRLVEQCKEAGGTTDRADIGTALHKLTELVDQGRALEHVQPQLQADVEAYRSTMEAHGIEVLTDYLEAFVVLDEQRLGGSFDMLARLPDGRVVVCDKKTGSNLDFSWLAFAVQLGCYSRGVLYDAATHVRTPLPDVDQSIGLIIHIPAGTGTCTLHEVDLDAGWEAAQVSIAVRQWRARKGLGKPWHNASAPSAGVKATASGPKRAGGSVETPSPAASASSTPSSSTTNGPSTDLTVGAPTVLADGHVDRRAWLLERLNVVKAHPAAYTLARARWAHAELPTFDACGPEHFDAVAALLDDVERAHELGFPSAPPEPELEPAAPAPRPVIDEGPDMERADVDALMASVAALAEPARGTFVAFAASVRDAKASVDPRVRPTKRRFQIVRAMKAWALAGDEELLRAGLVLVLGDDVVQESHPTGALLAALTIDEASTLEALANALDAGDAVADYSTGACRLRRAA